ncbi:hypothetical protein [Cryptosporangium minutisporangium]|uniref:hypothetical protein n=1 Tax=Cryptosporangium minutisporangium TaxID=113569 RepID=UPI0031F11EB2
MPGERVPETAETIEVADVVAEIIDVQPTTPDRSRDDFRRVADADVVDVVVEGHDVDDDEAGTTATITLDGPPVLVVESTREPEPDTEPITLPRVTSAPPTAPEPRMPADQQATRPVSPAATSGGTDSAPETNAAARPDAGSQPNAGSRPDTAARPEDGAQRGAAPRPEAASGPDAMGPGPSDAAPVATPVGGGALPSPTGDDSDPEPAAELLLSSEKKKLAGADEPVVVVDARPRYHLDACPQVEGRTPVELSVAQAIELGFTPCSRCAAATRLLVALRR